jgi:hypothetical protein
MKVVCISAGKLKGASSPKVTLTEGNVYDVIRVVKGNTRYLDDQYEIRNDRGSQYFYSCLRFKKLEDVRQEKLKILEV